MSADRVIVRALRLEVFVPDELVDPAGAPGRAVMFATLGTAMAQPVIDSSDRVVGGTRVVVIETDYALLEALGAYAAPADEP